VTTPAAGPGHGALPTLPPPSLAVACGAATTGVGCSGGAAAAAAPGPGHTLLAQAAAHAFDVADEPTNKRQRM
jgi:hypothetical protein